ncbi:Aspartate ammonia-lyase [Trypanosoma grayi]|uniref:Aspartate ammonia-lyase n=1 Tax=Trypanosoma grayi TaxID=71804 RepID=UPI0004F41CDD|nr:Aspartate ammonia-lyase [Trypanosoma grayi]KEG13503.1 Aspartate ammonia-lyase [Trypanosoma grayi]
MVEVEPKRVELCPTLKAVTVFKDRAQLTYSVSASLSVGRHALFMRGEKGWESIEQHTVQVRLEDAANQPVLMHGVRFENRATKEDMRERVRELEKKLDTVQESLDDVADKETINDALEAALKQVCEKLVIMGERGVGPDARADAAPIAGFLSDPTSWPKVMQFLTGRKRKVAEAKLLLSEEKKSLDMRKSELKKKIEDLRRGRQDERWETSVEVALSVEERPVELTLLVSFVAMGATWTPLYDLRVDPTQSTMDVTYHAQVQQNTSMDWSKVQMKLSTATPHFSSHPPELQKWCISLEPPVQTNLLLRSARMATPGGPMPLGALATAASSTEARAAQVEQAVVSSSSTVSTFEIAGLATVKSDNKPVKVTISNHTFPVGLVYHAVPKCSPSTYLLVKAKNTSPYVFLPGKTILFAGNTFIGNSELDMVPAGAEFTTSLGTDDTVCITRKQVSRKKSIERTMLRHPQERVQYVYEFTVKGSLAKEATLVVQDQSPIASSNDVSVTLREPNTKMLSEGTTMDGTVCTMDDLGVVEWKLQLPTGAFTRVFRFAFNVEYPEKMQVAGLAN